MQISEKRSKINFRNFLWHAIFLALASNFMDVDTIIPSMLIKAGGNSAHLGFLTAIMLGGSSVLQLLFAPMLSKKVTKLNHLLLGINLRVIALFLISLMLFFSRSLSGDAIIAGVMIYYIGFAAVFIFVSATMFVSYFFVRRLNCNLTDQLVAIIKRQ